MEQLLRSQEVPSVIPEVPSVIPEVPSVIPEVPPVTSEVPPGSWDLNSPVLYFPIRHHSLACGFHLKKAIEAYEPDCILIEGPENAGEMIPVLAHEQTRAPVALYYFFRDKKGLLSEKKEDYRCYYPFLDCSPELVALREAKAREIPARFIDLSYAEILLGTRRGNTLSGADGAGEDAAKENDAEEQPRESGSFQYNDDYLLSRSRYVRLLCEKTGLRSFAEFWEKYFEIEGLFLGTQEFVERMLAYCRLTRSHTPWQEPEDDGCLLRERYMAQQIAQASRDFQRILVVTGGFHTPALTELVKWQEDHFEYIGERVKLHSFGEGEQGVYPLAYSMEAADALNGYASGMQSPGFYQQVWEALMAGEEPEGVYREAVLNQLVRAGRGARKKKEGISSYDVICALSMARGLAALRGKREPGLYELWDGALSSFVKGERNASTDLPMRILQELNTGRQTGILCRDAKRPPLLSDFEQQCRRFGLKIQSSARQEVTLELFTKKKHLSMSRFFYQMEFLETGFAVRKKGADLVGRRDKSRIRELWEYRYGAQVLSALVDVSMAGATVAEAARAMMIRKFGESTGSRDAAALLARGFLMGFLEEQADMGSHIREVILEDGDFFSLTEGFSHLRMLYELQELYQVEDAAELSGLLHMSFQKIVQLLPSMAQVKEEQLNACMESCLSLYQMTGKKGFTHFRPGLLTALTLLLEKKDLRPGLEGAVLGILYGYDSDYGERIEAAAAGYLRGTEKRQLMSAAFLRGLFFTARDLVFVREGFLAMIHELLSELSVEAFLRLLPELRQAFGYFTPLETDRIAGRAAALCGGKKRELLKGRMVSPREYAYGEQLNAWAAQRSARESG